jgi:drug/metabolite transporter (DMT)-like permease
MTLFALGLVLVAAVFHATWNLLAKRVGDGGAVFVWLFGVCSVVIYAPLAVVVVLVVSPHLGPAQYLFMVGSGVLHLGYFVLLQRGYAVGDLSLVYPLALMTGVFIAAYTIWDKQAVSALLIPPLLQSWATTIVTTLLLTPVAMGNRKKIVALWRDFKLEAIGVGILSPLSYILVLTALVFTPVSYVAPAREISILIGAAMGSRLLAERDSTRRLIAAAAMVVGIVALALG